MHDQVVQFAWIAFFSIIAQWLGWRLKTPAIVFFLVFGFLGGPILEVIHPELLLGDLMQPLTSIAVGIILFEGSLNLNFKEIKDARVAIRHFVIIGAPLAWLLTSLSAYYIAGLSFEVSIIFGALLIVTGPTVIMPLLKNARLTDRPGSILKWEGLINDPIGAVLAVLAYEYFHAQSIIESFTPANFVSSVIVKIVIIMAISYIAGRFIAHYFNRGHVPEYMKSAALLSFVTIFFIVCNQFLHESGLIAVTVLGITMANMGITSLDDIKKFKETLSLMLVSGIFIILTANMDPKLLLSIDWRGFAFMATILFIIRPVVAAASSIGTRMTWHEVLLTGWIAPRGIVCAAIAGIMGPLLVQAGYEDGAKMLPLAFAIVLTTVFLHGFSVKPLAKWLKLSHPERDCIIIVGASAWSIQLAETLMKRDIEVLMSDKNWYALKNARLANVPTYYGEILSEETEYNLELAKFNTLLAVTNNPAYNSLVCMNFSHEFSRESTYQFPPHDEDDHEKKQFTDTIRGANFGDKDTDFWKLSDMFHQGWRFKITRLGKGLSVRDILQKDEHGSVEIFGYIRQANTLKKKLALKKPDKPEELREEDLVLIFESPEHAKNSEMKQKNTV